MQQPGVISLSHFYYKGLSPWSPFTLTYHRLLLLQCFTSLSLPVANHKASAFDKHRQGPRESVHKHNFI